MTILVATPAKIESLLGKEAEALLNYKCTKVKKEDLHIRSGLGRSYFSEYRPKPARFALA